MKNSIHIVLVGVGGYGNLYVNTLLDDTSGRYTFSMVDPYPGTCNRLEEALSRGIRLYGSLSEFYAENEADLAVISTPIHLHVPMILEALSHGSHVLCEKPLCGDEKDIGVLRKASAEAGRFVAIGYQWSHSDAIRNLKQDIMSGLFGRPVLFKTIVLWPRDHAYYSRGTGWAGKLKSKNGDLIRDSVANNATAHYLHNLFYLLGETMDSSLMPERIESRIFRANDIETFDTAVIRCGFGNGAEAVYIASHATSSTRNPEFVLRFEKGTVQYVQKNGEIIAEFTDGTVKNYGNPFASDAQKLYMAAENARLGTGETVCGVEAASVQTRVIAAVHDAHPEAERFPCELVKEKTAGGKVYTYCENLYEELNRLYNEL